MKKRTVYGTTENILTSTTPKITPDNTDNTSIQHWITQVPLIIIWGDIKLIYSFSNHLSDKFKTPLTTPVTHKAVRQDMLYPRGVDEKNPCNNNYRRHKRRCNKKYRE